MSWRSGCRMPHLRRYAYTAAFRRDIRQSIRSTTVTDEVDEDLPEQLRVRRAKYDRLVADADRAPFPVGVARTHSLAAVRAAHPDLAAGTETGETVGITDRKSTR